MIVTSDAIYSNMSNIVIVNLGEDNEIITNVVDQCKKLIADKGSSYKDVKSKTLIESIQYAASASRSNKFDAVLVIDQIKVDLNLLINANGLTQLINNSRIPIVSTIFLANQNIDINNASEVSVLLVEECLRMIETFAIFAPERKIFEGGDRPQRSGGFGGRPGGSRFGGRPGGSGFGGRPRSFSDGDRPQRDNRSSDGDRPRSGGFGGSRFGGRPGGSRFGGRPRSFSDGGGDSYEKKSFVNNLFSGKRKVSNNSNDSENDNNDN